MSRNDEKKVRFLDPKNHVPGLFRASKAINRHFQKFLLKPRITFSSLCASSLSSTWVFIMLVFVMFIFVMPVVVRPLFAKAVVAKTPG